MEANSASCNLEGPKKLSTKFTSFDQIPVSKFKQFQLSQQPSIQIKKNKQFLHQQQSKSETLIQESTEYNDTYEEIEVLGEGFQSICKKIQNKKTNELRVAKINLSAIDEETINQLKEEANILKKVDNLDCIMKGFETYENQSSFIQIVEFIDAKSLYDQLEDHNFSEEEINWIAYKVLQALQAIHQLSIIHRDITLSNILYDKNKKILKLVDFGVAKHNNEQFVMNFSQVGNQDYKSPEMLKNQAYSNKVDLWGLGLVLYSLITKKIAKSKTIIKIAKLNEQLEFPPGISIDLQNLIRGLLALKRKLRFSAEQALESPLFATMT